MTTSPVHFEIGRLEANIAMKLGYQVTLGIWNQTILEINTSRIEGMQIQIKRCYDELARKSRTSR